MAQLAWQWRERGQRDPSIAGYQPGGVRLWEKQDLHQESQNGTLTCLYTVEQVKFASAFISRIRELVLHSRT